MRGSLPLIILWMLSKKKMTGSEIALEFESKRGHKPSLGTIYPLLYDFKYKGFVSTDKNKKYSLTRKGKKELDLRLHIFFDIFYDIDEMRSVLKKDS